MNRDLFYSVTPVGSGGTQDGQTITGTGATATVSAGPLVKNRTYVLTAVTGDVEILAYEGDGETADFTNLSGWVVPAGTQARIRVTQKCYLYAHETGDGAFELRVHQTYGG